MVVGLPTTIIMYQTTLRLSLPPVSSFLAAIAAFCQIAAYHLLAWQTPCPSVTPKGCAYPQYPLDYAVALCSSSAELHSQFTITLEQKPVQCSHQ